MKDHMKPSMSEKPGHIMLHVVRCTIWYHLYNLKNVKNTDGGVLIAVKLQAPVSQSPIFKNFLCASSATTFMVLTHCLHYCVASCNYGDSRARDAGPTCWPFRAMPDNISTCDVNRGYYMLLLFLFVLLLFACFCFLLFCFFLGIATWFL